VLPRRINIFGRSATGRVPTRVPTEDTRVAFDWIDSQERCPLKRDPEIHQDVRAELWIQEDEGGRSVEISVQHGVVSLTGLVESYAQKCAIGRAVRHIVGVKDLRDYLHVRPSDGAAPDDPQIERAANRALGWDVRVPRGIRAKVSGGVLRLRGTVERFGHWEAAEEAVRNLMGVRDIVNEIVLLPATPAAHLALEVEAALRRRLGPASRVISVVAAQGVVTLRGTVPTFAILGEMERAVWSIPGVTQIDNQLQVS
jgi:osmotically-inducible protein OsmY